MTHPEGGPDFELLTAYWLGELDPAAEDALEARLFADPATEERLAAIAALDAGLVALARAGRLRGTLTLDAVTKLRAAGLKVREYTIVPGQVVPCTIADEDLMVIRLRGPFEGVSTVDIDLEWRLQGQDERVEPQREIPVDVRANEVILSYVGNDIRALPRSGFTYRVSVDGERRLGDFHLEHTPRA